MPTGELRTEVEQEQCEDMAVFSRGHGADAVQAMTSPQADRLAYLFYQKRE